jgi:methionyl-tRNA formyltransferase
MLRIVFFGMETRILDKLRRCHVQLKGAFLPAAPYWVRKKWPLLAKFPWIVKRFFRTAAVYGHVSDYLESNTIPALKSDDINSESFRDTLRRLQPDLGLVANFGGIFDASVLNIPKHGFINMHPSLLPRYRGPDPFGHVLLNGESISGVTWHQMTSKIDQGDILAQATFPVEPHDTIKDMERKSIDLAIEMLPPLLADIETGRVKPQPQNEADATTFPKLSKKEKAHLKAMGIR